MNRKYFSIVCSFIFIISIAGLRAESPNSPVKVIPQEDAKKEKKKKDEFKVYAGVNFNNLIVDSDQFKSNLGIGWMVGGAYKRGRFFYWEAGLRYNNAGYDLTPETSKKSATPDGAFSLHNIDVPITVGLNFLSFASRIVGLRLFVGATPEFVVGVGSNDIGVDMDNLNTFNILGNGGIGVDVLFLYLESGVNYGFVDVLKNDINSKPFQFYINLGFRF